MRGIRTDIPADHYEGCRPAAVDLKLGNYVSNSIKELDIYRLVPVCLGKAAGVTKSCFRKYYDNTTWCFCFLDHRCNDALRTSSSVPLILGLLSAAVLAYLT